MAAQTQATGGGVCAMSLVRVRAKNHHQQVRRRGPDDRANTRTTPDAVWRAVEREFGPFTLDAAASLENTRCDVYYTIESSGLSQEWNGRVWCNPPYSHAAEWVKKAVQESLRCEIIVMLLPANRTEQRWWQAYIEPTRDRPDSRLRTRFLPGRLEFGPPARDGKGNRPPFGCVLLMWT